ncbi:MAG TPA: type II toxin-antitoxin system death-on-curing family toxin [Candidatus Paceibacterota bacterium]
MTRYLSAEVILVMHSEVIDATGGSHGVRDAHLLAAIADKPRAAFGGKDLYRGVFKKAAVYLESIVNYHVFVDGNKRTGITACARFLFINGYDLAATNREVEMFVLSIVKKGSDDASIAAWLKTHTKKRAPSAKKR